MRLCRVFHVCTKCTAGSPYTHFCVVIRCLVCCCLVKPFLVQYICHKHIPVYTVEIKFITDRQLSVQLFYFMTSGPLKASHIKTWVKKKVESSKTIYVKTGMMAASPYKLALIETRIHVKKSRKIRKTDAKNSVYVQFRVNYFKRPATHLTIVIRGGVLEDVSSSPKMPCPRLEDSTIF